MKKLFEIIGILFILSGIVFLLIHSFIVTASPDESFSRDLFGFPIPQPPVWTSYIPYAGHVIGLIFELFSLHGLIGTGIAGILFYIGSLFMNLDKKQ